MYRLPAQLPCASLLMWYERAGAAPLLMSMRWFGAGTSVVHAYQRRPESSAQQPCMPRLEETY